MIRASHQLHENCTILSQTSSFFLSFKGEQRESAASADTVIDVTRNSHTHSLTHTQPRGEGTLSMYWHTQGTSRMCLKCGDRSEVTAVSSQLTVKDQGKENLHAAGKMRCRGLGESGREREEDVRAGAKAAAEEEEFNHTKLK